MLFRRCVGTAVLVLLFPLLTFAQSNGKLQIHFIDVGQGDAAVLISPQGEVVLFDNGVLNQCSKPVAYLQSLGVTKIDYHIASHYHADHIGCTGTILGTFPLQKAAYDRGGSYTTATYTNYVNAVGAKRTTAQKGQTLVLDQGNGTPVTITFAALNGNGISTTDENDQSLVSVVRFGQFDAVFGGDLSGGSGGPVDPETACSYSVSPTSYSASTSAGSFTVSVTTSAGCLWTTAAGASWLTLGSSGGSGSGSVSVYVAGNSAEARSSSVTIAGRTVSVSQSGVTPVPTDACPASPPPPAGATARCRNGQWSSSQNRPGTCSSNGGVACWVCPGRLCTGLTDGVYASERLVTAEAYADIESSVAALVGNVEVYKVHHHGSKFSSNSTWLSTTAPKVGVISAGATNSYGHPTQEALDRLHGVGMNTYWTSSGNGAAPLAGRDFIAGSTVIQVDAGSSAFAVTYSGTTHSYGNWVTTPAAPTLVSPEGSIASNAPTFRWNAVTGATWYRVFVNDSTGQRLDQWVTKEQAGCAAGTGQCAVSGVTLASGTGQWWALAYNSAGTGPWSGTKIFTVSMPVPAAAVGSLYPVSGASPGGTATLWAQVQNTGGGELPAGARVWFFVNGPGWAGDHWVGSADAAGIAAGATVWRSFTWTLPAGASPGTYTYWAQVWTSNVAISAWSSPETFGVAVSPPVADVLEVYPVNGGAVAKGSGAVLWALVSNSGRTTLPAGTKVWFFVSGPGWSGDHWIGATLTEGLQAGAQQWFSLTWATPTTAQTGTYTYWAQVWSGTAISGWSPGKTFVINP